MPSDVSPIHIIRSYPVILDAELARRFGVETRRLNEQVKRNAARFSEDFAFQITHDEWADLTSQTATAKGRGGRRSPPWVYTEHGVVMAATVLKSDAAIAASRLIVRTFVAARRADRLKAPGQNDLTPIDLGSVLPTQATHSGDTGAGSTLAARVGGLITRILDTIANDEEGTTVREESRTIIAKSLGAIRAHLDAKGIENERTVTEIRKLLAEIEAIDADVVSKTIEADHRRLAYLAKQLQLVIGLQTYLEQGEADAFLSILRDLSGD